MPGDSARHLSVQLRDKLHAESHGALLVLVPRKVRAIEEGRSHKRSVEDLRCSAVPTDLLLE